MKKIKQLIEKDKQLRDWIQAHELVRVTGMCLCIAFNIFWIGLQAWNRNVEGIVWASVATSTMALPYFVDAIRGDDSDDEDEVDGDEPDDPASPTGDSADRWLRSRMSVAR